MSTLTRANPHYVIHFPMDPRWRDVPDLDDFTNRLISVVEKIRELGVRLIAVRLEPDLLPHGMNLDHLFGMLRAALDPEPVEIVELTDPRVEAIVV